jgi:hypothetical protein
MHVTRFESYRECLRAPALSRVVWRLRQSALAETVYALMITGLPAPCPVGVTNETGEEDPVNRTLIDNRNVIWCVLNHIRSSMSFVSC